MNESHRRALESVMSSALSFVRGDIIDGVRHAADALLEIYPADAAKQVIDDAAVRRANIAYYAAEAAKFGPEKP